MFSIKSSFLRACTLLSLLVFAASSHALPASELRAVIVTPFPFAQGATAQNIRDEMNIDSDLPQMTFDYFQSLKAFKSISLIEAGTKVDADIYIKGEILQVLGGNGAARRWGGFAGAGRSSMVVSVKVYDQSNQLLHDTTVIQNGARGGTVFSVWSNKKNITTAMKTIPKKIFIAALAGDLSTEKGVVRAMKSRNPVLIQAGAISSNKYELFNDEVVTDSMEEILLSTLEGDNNDKYFIDGAAWCAINLGKSSNKKYIATLEKVMASKASKKIKKHGKNALNTLKD